MDEEQETGKEWVTPEIIDMDVDKTASGTSTNVAEDVKFHS